MAGIISGKTNNVFDPQGTATRAEVSALLKRFVELAAFSYTAQGWTMNDSGKWMYYENGKLVTGEREEHFQFHLRRRSAKNPTTVRTIKGVQRMKEVDAWLIESQRAVGCPSLSNLYYLPIAL